MKQRVHIITLGVASLDRAREFYDALGWTRANRAETGIIAYDLYGATLALFPKDKLEAEIGTTLSPGSGSQTLACNTREKDQIDTVIAAARDAGATILRAPFDTDWGGRSSYFSDPDGHIWECAWNPHSPLGDDDQFQWSVE